LVLLATTYDRGQLLLVQLDHLVLIVGFLPDVFELLVHDLPSTKGCERDCLAVISYSI
jgi:hypothetical protein